MGGDKTCTGDGTCSGMRHWSRSREGGRTEIFLDGIHRAFSLQYNRWSQRLKCCEHFSVCKTIKRKWRNKGCDNCCENLRYTNLLYSVIINICYFYSLIMKYLI